MEKDFEIISCDLNKDTGVINTHIRIHGLIKFKFYFPKYNKNKFRKKNR